MANQLRHPVSVPCVSGTIHQAPPNSPGTHLLADARGNPFMLVRSDTINLTALAGRRATLCGHLRSAHSPVHGFQRVLNVTSAQPLAIPIHRPAAAGCG